jgi:hypothetical protein
MRILQLGCLFALILNPLPAQQTVKPEPALPVFSGVPFWPPDGQPPADLADTHFVYLDYGRQEYVISYPDISGTSKIATGRRVEYRVKSQGAVAPDLSVAISKSESGPIVYSYTVRNGLAAKGSIGKFAVIAAADDDSIALSHPDWSPELAPVTRGAIPARDADRNGPELRIRAGAGRIVGWTAGSNRGIGRSGSGSGFQIRSKFLPGITGAFASTAVAYQLPNSLPEEVVNQLSSVLSPEYDWKSSVTIGPKFNPDNGPSRDPVWIADDYRLAIEKLRIEGKLGQDSAFIDELISLLDAVSAGGARIPLRYRNLPVSELGKEIAAAARIALSSE